MSSYALAKDDIYYRGRDKLILPLFRIIQVEFYDCFDTLAEHIE